MTVRPSLATTLAIGLLIAGCSTTTHRPSADSTKQAAQNAMRAFVVQQAAETGTMPVVYQGRVLQLEPVTSEKYPDGFHTGVATHANLYTSCADFRDPHTGMNYDIDFLVNKIDGRFHVVQPIVHKVNGVKNPYGLCH